MKHILLLLLPLLLLILLHPHPSHAHNGAVAIAVPVQGIVVDGDLSEWPDGMREYEIELCEYGDKPVNEEDFKGWFRVGYNEQENALYVAVEVQDESVVVDESAGTAWDSKDGCEVYVDEGHGKNGVPVTQYAIRGKNRSVSSWENIEVKVQRSVDFHQYEWRIDLNGTNDGRVELCSGMLVVVDVVVCDKDSDGSFSWMAWGPGAGKVASSDRVGLVVLGEDTAFGKLKGKIKWEDMEEGVRLGRVRIQSLESDDIWVEVKTDSQGVYEVELPVGNYEIQVGYRPRWKESFKVEVKKGGKVEVKEGGTERVEEIFFEKPPFGLVTKAGAGLKRGFRQNLEIPDGLPSPHIYVIYQDRKGYLWFGTAEGVSRYDGQTFITFTKEDDLAGNYVFSILEDRKGNLWFGTEGGVSRYDGEQLITLTKEDDLAGNHVLCMLEDRKGNLWFGTRVEGGGVSCYDDKDFTSFTETDGLGDNGVLCMLEDRKGNLWFGTESGGVSRYDGEQVVTFTEAKGLADNDVLCMLEDRKGNLWFGTRAEGVSRYDGKSFTTFTEEDGLASNLVGSLLEDGAGNLWFGGTLGGGVSRYDGQRFTTFTEAKGLADNDVLCMLEDREGDLWFGTEGGGVSRYDGEQFVTFNVENGLADNHVLCMLEDGKANLWFGTEGGGVSRYDGKQFVTFSTRDGLGKNVSSILETREGNLWFGQLRKGVSQYDGLVFQCLLKYDGLVNYEVNQLLQDRNGDIWIATSDGVTRYHPQHISPPIFLTDVRADRRYDPIQEVRIPSSQQFIIFEFQGLSFKTRSGQIVYLYQLLGLE